MSYRVHTVLTVYSLQFFGSTESSTGASRASMHDARCTMHDVNDVHASNLNQEFKRLSSTTFLCA